MSLLQGMNTLFENKAAMEAASDEAIFEEMVALEADELIDTVVDGKGPFEDEVGQMFDEDEATEQMNMELDEEDNSIADANEAAALTGSEFLSSLMKDTDDPITTKPGSVGQQSSAASFAGNFSDAADDNNDPIKTEPGSVGPEDSAANHDKNFSDEADDNNDPIKTNPGSVGQKDSTAKDPVMESALVFGALMGTEEAMESLIAKMTPAQEMSRMEQDVATLGINSIDCDKVDSLIKEKKYDEAKSVCESWIKDINKAVKDTVDEAKESAAQRLIASTSSLSVAIEAQRLIDEDIAKGTDPEIATESAIKRLSAKRDEKKEAGTLDAASESVINIALNWFVANEAGEISDPEATEDGSVGQDSSKAHASDNFSDGALDNNDPVQTKDGAEGQEDSAASFNENHSGGSLDTDDPIHTDDGSVGQKDSTAKDPAAEASSLSALEELEALTRMMDDEAAGLND